MLWFARDDRKLQHRTCAAATDDAVAATDAAIAGRFVNDEADVAADCAGTSCAEAAAGPRPPGGARVRILLRVHSVFHYRVFHADGTGEYLASV